MEIGDGLENPRDRFELDSNPWTRMLRDRVKEIAPRLSLTL